MRATLILLLLLGLAGPATASCRFLTDCSRQPCRQVQTCDSALDPPASPSPGTGQTVPTGSPTPRTLGPSSPVPAHPLVPPPGASGCRQAYVCVLGRCAWQFVCE